MPLSKVAYLDLDGVLVDFVKGALKLHNSDIKPSEIVWDIDKQLGLTPEQFWSPFNFTFWANLEWTPEGKEILELVESVYGDNIAILTSPPKTGGAVEGKLAWVAKNMPKYKRKTFVGARKELMAAPSKLLIDDREENVDNFMEAGGGAILIPRPWNRNKDMESELMSILRTVLL